MNRKEMELQRAELLSRLTDDISIIKVSVEEILNLLQKGGSKDVEESSETSEKASKVQKGIFSR